MRIIHLGDLHLGKALGEFSLIEDQKYILNHVLDIIREKDIDAVLIAGGGAYGVFLAPVRVGEHM